MQQKGYNFINFCKNYLYINIRLYKSGQKWYDLNRNKYKIYY